jgi:hypothetical protein
MNKTAFTAYKLASIDHAAADQRLTALGFRLLWLLASAADWKTGVTRPLTQTEADREQPALGMKFPRRISIAG